MSATLEQPTFKSPVATAGERGRESLSVVVPCYNESEVIDLFYRELVTVLERINDLDAELLFVDDGSSDDTLEKLNHIAADDRRVQVYSFSRNFGHQFALTAGLDHARGDAVIMMDSDLQHPPTLIPKMIELWRGGYDVVSTIRLDTADAPLFKKAASRSFYFIINALSNTRIPMGAADFCLLSRKVYQVMRSMRERHRFLRGLVSWTGFERALLPYEAKARAAGNSKYTMRKNIAMALDAAFSFSTVPIRLATHVGLLVVFLGFIYLGWNFVKAFGFGYAVPGWASLLGLTMILGGSNLLFLGVVGQYVARVFEEAKDRPMYILKQHPAESTAAPAPLATTASDAVQSTSRRQSADRDGP